jgi:peptide/nickel transport system permease protein
MFGKMPDPELMARIRHDYGLDRPVYLQYLTWAWNIVHGNLGYSIRAGAPVSQLISERLPATMSLVILSMIISLSISIPVGIISATKPHSFRDYFGVTLSLVGISTPMFWLAIVAILLFSYYLKIFPSFGYVPILEDPINGLRHLLLPSASLGVILAGTVIRITRSSMLEVLGEDYVKFATLKGLTRRVVVIRHALKNALIPVITIVAIQMGYLLGGTVPIEVVFAWPGIGSLLLNAIEWRDYPLIQALILLYALLFFLCNLVADILYSYVDPRIRFGGSKQK